MSSESSGKRRVVAEIRDAMRELSVQLSLLNGRVSARLEVRPVDLQCLDLITRHGPLSPTAVARRAGMHPATMTGVLDRLERGGWIVRERDPEDRRGVVVRRVPERGAEIFALYRGMNSSLEEILAGYDDDQLATLADFLRRSAAAGQRAADDLG